MIKHCYIHIPFCNSICSYCDFCKVFYNENQVEKYLNSLINEYNALYKIYSAANNPEKKDELEKKLEEIEKEYHTNKVANNELKNESPKFVELLAMHINKKIEDKVDIDKINHPIVKGDFSNGGIEVEFPDGTKAIFENPIGELRKLYRRRNWR